MAKKRRKRGKSGSIASLDIGVVGASVLFNFVGDDPVQLLVPPDVARSIAKSINESADEAEENKRRQQMN